MAAPTKPWEFVGQNNRNYNPMNNSTLPSNYGGSDFASGVSKVRIYNNPPPLPPRQNRRFVAPSALPRQSVYPVMGNYSYPGYGQFNQYGMGYNNYSSYGGYNRLGGYGFGNSLGGYPNNTMESRLIQTAEERARPAFQSIESVLQTFSAISLMLDSTFMAMHTSFRAVLGVAENFAKLRSFLKQFLSAIATLKLVRWFYRHILYLLGLMSKNANKEDLWQQALRGVEDTASAVSVSPQSRMSVPVVMFMGLMLCGPYLIFKLLNSLYPTEDEPVPAWNPSADPYQLVRANYDFQAQAEGELSFQQGQTLKMAPITEVEQSSGWALVSDHFGRIGYAPLNRLSLGPVLPQNPQKPHLQAKATDQTSIPSEETSSQPGSQIPDLPSENSSQSAKKLDEDVRT